MKDKKLERLVTDDPQDNVQAMLNLTMVKDDEVWMRCCGQDENDVRLTDFIKEICVMCSCEDLQYLPDSGNLDDFGDAMMGCAMWKLCPVANAYWGLVGCCELRERLRLYENAGGKEHEQG